MKKTGNKIRLNHLLFFIAILFLLGAAAPANFKIIGVKDDVLKNIEERIKELYSQKTMSDATAKFLHDEVEKAMYPYGYFKPHITIQFGRSKRSGVIRIRPGPRMRITSFSLQVEGPGRLEPEIVKAANTLALKPGQPFSNDAYEKAKDKLLTAAEHEGYLRTSFTTSEVLINRKQYTLNIKLVFNTGPQFFFGRVHFDPTYLCPQFLHRYVQFHYGQTYSTDAVLDLESNLSSSGYFKSLTVKPKIRPNQTFVPVNVHMQQANRVNYSFGLGYGTDTGLRGRAGYHVVPVNRWGHKFNAIAQGSFAQNALLAQYIIPGLNPVTDNFAITGSFTNLEYNVGNSAAGQLSFAQQHNTTNYQRIISLNILQERYNYSSIPSFPRVSQRVIYPQANLTWRHAPDPLFSPSGYNITLTGLAAAKAMMSSVTLSQILGDAKAAITVDAIRTRFFFHAMQGGTSISNINDLPLSLALLLGGAMDMKGYNFNSLGPGKVLSYAGLEIQKETVDKWYFIGFYDVGNVYRPFFNNFKYDVGIALMWVSPVGPIKVGVAQAINQKRGRVRQRAPKLVINMGPDL